MSKKYVESVNLQVANFTVLYEKLHHYHWFLKGHHFFTLHVKFEELYTEVTAHLDAIAERMLIIGEKPISTLKKSLETASINEASDSEQSEQEMVQAVIDDFTSIIGEMKETISASEEAGDHVTADMFISISESLGKHVWMLKAFLG